MLIAVVLGAAGLWFLVGAPPWGTSPSLESESEEQAVLQAIESAACETDLVSDLRFAQDQDSDHYTCRTLSSHWLDVTVHHPLDGTFMTNIPCTDVVHHFTAGDGLIDISTDDEDAAEALTMLGAVPNDCGFPEAQ